MAKLRIAGSFCYGTLKTTKGKRKIYLKNVSIKEGSSKILISSSGGVDPIVRERGKNEAVCSVNWRTLVEVSAANEPTGQQSVM